MSERFTEILRAASGPAWWDTGRHRFVSELFAGAVPDAVMARYLIQDHRFLDSFLTLLGATLASADTFEARVRFGRFIGMVSGEENTFFLRAFEALGVTEDRRTADPDTQPTAGFKAIMREAAETRSYAAALSVLVVAEWLYLDWASRAPQRCRPISYTRSGSRCTTIQIFVGSSISCPQSWTGSARRTQICAATSFLALSRSNSPFSKPPIRAEFSRGPRHRSGGINDTCEIHGCNRLSGQGGDGRLRGTDGSNPASSSGESGERLRGSGPP